MKGLHGTVLVYDDAVEVPADVASVAGVRRFGALLRRRERLRATVAALAQDAGVREVVHVRDATDLDLLARRVRADMADDRLYLLLPANYAPTAPRDEAVLFLRKLGMLTEPVALWRDGRPLAAGLLDRAGLLAYAGEGSASAQDPAGGFLQEVVADLPPVDDALGLADLADLTTAIEFLSGSFSARHFNHVAQDRYEVVKRSSDRRKMRREHDFYGLLPAAMQPFFVQPFGFEEDGDGASYRMRRLFVPDLAVQWVHHALSDAEFAQALDHIMHFIASRARRPAAGGDARRVADELYRHKLAARVDQLLALPDGRRVDATLQAGGVDGGVRALQQRFERAWDRAAGGLAHRELCVGHGDLCFSNILYSPITQSLQLIDPRGAERAEELWTDPLYDVAKLSHSILGGYDFIVAGLFDLDHDEDLALRLRLDPAPVPEQQRRFATVLAGAGFDVRLVRLCEASLFLSMLPLHIDVPKRVVAFALRAQQILTEFDA